MVQDPAITSDQMYSIEENGSTRLKMPKFLMMENAGHSAADFLVSKFAGRIRGKKVVVVCGTGNNGGDGFVVSRHLACYGPKLTVILLGRPKDIRTKEASMNWSIIAQMNETIHIVTAVESALAISQLIVNANIIVDAIFGTGIKGEIAEPFATAIDAINRSKGYTLALDVPSGLDPNSGKPKKKCVKADATVTFHRLKKGLRRGRGYTGPIQVARIGIPPEAEAGVL